MREWEGGVGLLRIKGGRGGGFLTVAMSSLNGCSKATLYPRSQASAVSFF